MGTGDSWTCFLKLFISFNLAFSCTLMFAQADVMVLNEFNQSVDVFASLPASFGTSIPLSGLEGAIVAADPRNACESIAEPPDFTNYTGKWFVLISRFGCSFADKVRSAQLSGYDAAIIYNIGSNTLEPMGGQDADDINIPSLFIGQDDGLMIAAHYQYNKRFQILLTNDQPFNLNNYLLPFAIVVAICFFLMLAFFVVKCIKDRRRMRRYRLPSSSLKKIPTAKFKKGDPYEVCAICLDEYIDGDKLRLLPCSHAYHCKCIDPWLTRNRRVCPICKRRVLAQGEHISDSEESETESETRPLLRPGSYGTQGGTFSNIPAAHSVQEPGPSLSHESQQLEESAVVHEAPSPSPVPVVITINESENTVAEQADVDLIDHSQPPSDPELGRTPTNQTCEDLSIYLTPQNNWSRDDIDV